MGASTSRLTSPRRTEQHGFTALETSNAVVPTVTRDFLCLAFRQNTNRLMSGVRGIQQGFVPNTLAAIGLFLAPDAHHSKGVNL